MRKKYPTSLLLGGRLARLLSRLMGVSEFIVYMLCVGANGSHSCHFVLIIRGRVAPSCCIQTRLAIVGSNINLPIQISNN